MCLSKTASSKQRSHLRKAVASEKKKLTKCIRQYNELCIEDDNYCSTSVSAILDGDFPWSLLTGKLTIHVHIKLDPLLKFVGH